MPRLKANFEADWISQMRSHLVNIQGWPAAEVASLDNREVRLRYFDAMRRRIAPRPRLLKIADDFLCPPLQLPGWQLLQQRVQKGEDLNPNLSKRHASLLNLDGLLNEWGVHHFHLGVGPDAKEPAYVGRTGPLLYALVTDEVFLAINIYTHASFEDSAIVESIHRNWPDMISRYRLKAATGFSGEALNPLQRRSLRNHSTNVLFSTADGTVYMPLSGGVMASGITAEATFVSDRWHDKIQRLQPEFEKQLHEVLPTLTKQGYAGEDEIEAELRLSDNGVQVFFPKFGVLVNVRGLDTPTSVGP
jgi:hypothetical protein